VPVGDIAALDKALDDRTCAFLFEPIQGEGGVLPLDAAYLRQAQKLCKERVSFRRRLGPDRRRQTGALLACMKMGLEPDPREPRKRPGRRGAHRRRPRERRWRRHAAARDHARLSGETPWQPPRPM
jgi:hypothetical protein